MSWDTPYTGSEVVAMTWDSEGAMWVLKCSCGWAATTPYDASARWMCETHGAGHWGQAVTFGGPE